MSIKAPQSNPLSWTQWAGVTTEVRDARQAELSKKLQATEIIAPGPSGVVEPLRTSLGARVAQLLAKFPALQAAPESERAAALQAVLGQDALYASLTTLAQGLSQLAAPEAHHPTVSYSRTAALLQQVRDLRGALSSAKSAVPSFPKAQLDGLEEALRANLRGLATQHGAGVRQAEAKPLEKVLNPKALELLTGLRAAVASFSSSDPDPTLVAAAHHRFDAPHGVSQVLSVAGYWPDRAFGLSPAQLDGQLTARALEKGGRLDAAQLVALLFERASRPAAQDVLHAFLGAHAPELAPTRVIEPFSPAVSLTPLAQRLWQTIQPGGYLGQLREQALKDGIFDQAVQSQGGRCLDPDALLDLLARRADNHGPAAAELNRVCLSLRMEPIAGLPSGLQAQRRALIDRANEVSEAVASTGAALQHLQQRAQEALSPLIAQLTTLTTELSRGTEVAAKVKEAQAIFDQSEVLIAGFLAQATKLGNGAAKKHGQLSEALREQGMQFRVELGVLRGQADAKDPSLAQALHTVEQSLTTRLRNAQTSVDQGLRTGVAAGVHQYLQDLRGNFGNYLVNALTVASRSAVQAEQRAEAELAMKAAEAERTKIASVPLDVDRLRTASEVELTAYQIRGDVHGQVLRLRRAGLPPETFDRVATESFAFQGNQLAPKPQVGAFANAVWQTVNLLQNVGSGLSYKGAADWLRGNTDTMVAWQHREADKVAIRAFLTALATDLDAR